ncbi:UDP-N-acetylmuramoyl-tripeptide--D-alanyl-D-alanine ligase [Halanaerocella petrolearia]
MKSLSANEIVTAVTGDSTSNLEFTIDRVSTDTRTLESGALFIALVGDNFDGHNFVADAFAKGAKVAIVSQAVEVDGPLIVVEDTQQALQDLAAYYRSQFSLPVVAVTGSTGKTTTKDMIAAVLQEEYQTLKTQGNYNNEIGLPLTLFQLEEKHQALVVEMGMRGLGQIRDLAQIAQPDIGVVTNVGVSHIELLGSQEKIAQAKGELIEFLDQDGVAILNSDDQYVSQMDELTAAQLITYGLEEGSQLQAINIETLGEEGVSFEVVNNETQESIQVKLPIPGRYNVYNALAAIAVGLALDLELSVIKEGLSNLKLTKMRNQIVTTDCGLEIINDTYNANPTSMQAAINTLDEIAVDRKIAILGDMLELGEVAKEEHRKIGKLIANKGLDFLFATGELGSEIAQGAIVAGMDKQKVFHFTDREELKDKLLTLVESGDTILVKASRGMKLEEFVDLLQNKE